MAAATPHPFDDITTRAPAFTRCCPVASSERRLLIPGRDVRSGLSPCSSGLRMATILHIRMAIHFNPCSRRPAGPRPAAQTYALAGTSTVGPGHTDSNGNVNPRRTFVPTIRRRSYGNPDHVQSVLFVWPPSAVSETRAQFPQGPGLFLVGHSIHDISCACAGRSCAASVHGHHTTSAREQHCVCRQHPNTTPYELERACRGEPPGRRPDHDPAPSSSALALRRPVISNRIS